MGNFREINPPELQVLLREHQEGIASVLNCIKVGIIQEFNPAVQTCTIQLTTKRQIGLNSLDPNASPILIDYPLLLDCPLIINGGLNSGITFPDIVGSECLVLFNDREMDNWFTASGVQSFTSLRMHDLSDGFALLRPRSLPNVISDYDTTNVVLYNGIKNIKITPSRVEINGDLIINGDLVVTGEITTTNINTPLINGTPV